MKSLRDIGVGLPPKRDLPVKGPTCATCDDTGWKPVLDQGRRAVVVCPDCLERRRGFAPGVPVEEQQTALNDWAAGKKQATESNKAAILQAQFFLQDVHPGLYIHGGVGCGKTSLACAVLNDLHRAGRAVRFVRVTDLMAEVVTDDTGDQVFRRLADVAVLCLDDLGAQKGSDYARQTLVRLCDARADRGRRTIWTSNLGLDELVTWMGDDERLASRIAGSAKDVALDGPDYRLRKARKRQQKGGV